MNKKIINSLGLVILIVAFGVLAASPLGDIAQIFLETGASPNSFQNVSGSAFNLSLSIVNGTSGNNSIGNVSIMWQLHSNTSNNYTNANHSFMANVTITNTSANQTIFAVSFDTTTLPDGQYNITIGVYNISTESGAQTGIHNESFAINVTVDNTVPKITLNSAATVYVNKGSSKRNVSFNVTASDVLTGVQTVLFQFSNGTTPFNKTATNRTGTWNVHVNMTTVVDGTNYVVVFGKDYAGSTNRTVNITLLIDTVNPTLTLTKNTAGSDSSTLKLDVATSTDATCITSQGSVSGSGAAQTIIATGLAGSTSYSFTVTCTDERGNNKVVTQSFTTDASSGGSGSASAASVSRSSGSSGKATAGVVADGQKEEEVEEVVEEVAPPSVPTDVAAEPTPSAGAADVPRDFPTEETQGGSVVGWVIAVVVLLGLVAAYFVWSKKN